MSHHMNEDKQLVNLCSAWKNFKVGDFLLGTNIRFRIVLIFRSNFKLFLLNYVDAGYSCILFIMWFFIFINKKSINNGINKN